MKMEYRARVKYSFKVQERTNFWWSSQKQKTKLSKMAIKIFFPTKYLCELDFLHIISTKTMQKQMTGQTSKTFTNVRLFHYSH